MSWLDGLRHRLRTAFAPERHAAELREEMRLHLELAAQEEGDPALARRRFGNEVWHAEEARRMTWLAQLDPLRQDVRYAARNVMRTPGFTVIVVLTLALGVGVNAVVFSLLDRIYLSPPAGLAEPESLRRIWIEHPGSGTGDGFMSQALNYPLFEVISGAARSPADLAVFTVPSEQRLGREAGAPRVRASYSSSNLFDVLGARTSTGRYFTEAEARLGAAADVAVISDSFRRRHFAGVAVPGATLAIGDRIFTVIGVADPAFTGLDLNPTDVWLPLGSRPSDARGSWWESWSTLDLNAVLRAGGSDGPFAERATTRLNEAWRRQYPQRGGPPLILHTGSIIEARGPDEPGQETVIATRLAGVSVIVLLIACANVINLLLARAVQRRRENAVRLALGVPLLRLARSTLLEILLLAVLAGAGALLAAAWGGAALRTLLLPDVEWRTPVLDLRLTLFTIAVALAAGLIAAIVPAFQSARVDLTRALKAGTRQSGRQRSILRSGLLALQAAFSVLLLAGAALFVQSLRNVQSLDIGYDADRLLFGSVEFAEGEYPPAAVHAALVEQAAERLSRAGGVASVARANIEPMRGLSFTNFHTDTDSLGSFVGEMPTLTVVSPAYFRTTGLGVVAGRTLSGSADEVVVSERMAALAWGGGDPLGRCMYFEGRGGPCTRVVGVVRDARRDQVIEEAPAAQYYLPFGHAAARAFAGTALIVRAQPEAVPAAAAELRSALQAAFPAGLPMVTPMAEHLEPQYRPWRLGAQLFTGLGLLALLVALIGIYTTVSYGVSQRTHEFGVRLALGAQLRDVVRQVVGEGLRVVGIGIAAGVLLTLIAARLAAALLYGVQPHDAGALAAVALSVLSVAALAALVPAWRAARVDPLRTLREE